MTREVIWVNGAESDLLLIYSRVEGISSGAGDRLMEQAGQFLELLKRQPFMVRCWLGPVRRVSLHRSGMGLFYVVEPRRLVVIAVLDLRRSPRALRDEIKRRLPG